MAHGSTLRAPLTSPAPAPVTLPAGVPTAGVPTAGTGPRDAAAIRYRPEVQGLRALAVLMVVSYHIWFGRISGGVDIFLLISAFLLTGHFTKLLDAGRPLALLAYWVRLFRRMMPLLVVVLLGTLAAGYLFLPQSRWAGLLEQGWASLFYVQNWFLAAESVDYYATDHSVASPLQHFWSLSIQGQIFLLWPLLFALAGVLARLTRVRVRPLLILLFGLLFASSLAFSIVSTATNQEFACFDTRTRLWEFALGTLLAVLLPWLRLGRRVRFLLGWAGIVGMLSCGIVLQVGQQFPGYMALWPTVAAAAVILAGSTDSPWGADRLLRSRPLVWVGDHSFALYLVHWPVLVFYLITADTSQAGPLAGSLIILGSLLVAWALTRWVDAPLRRHRWLEATPGHGLLALLLGLVLVGSPLLVWQQQLGAAARPAAALSGSAPSSPGAAALLPGFPEPGFPDQGDPVAPLIPALSSIEQEWPQFPISCGSGGDAFFNRCSNGIVAGTQSVVVLGSSHAHVFNTPLLALAEDNNWSVTSMTKGLCPLGQDPAAGISVGCVEYNASTLAEVLALQPDLVVTTSTRTDSRPGVNERLDPAWVTDVQALNDAGIKVLAVRDTPRVAQSVPQCLERFPDDFSGCGAPRENLFAATDPTDAVAALLPLTTFVDLTHLFCTELTCPAVVGNVIVYKDDNHITRTYMSTLTPYFRDALAAATGWPVR